MHAWRLSFLLIASFLSLQACDSSEKRSIEDGETVPLNIETISSYSDPEKRVGHLARVPSYSLTEVPQITIGGSLAPIVGIIDAASLDDGSILVINDHGGIIQHYSMSGSLLREYPWGGLLEAPGMWGAFVRTPNDHLIAVPHGDHSLYESFVAFSSVDGEKGTLSLPDSLSQDFSFLGMLDSTTTIWSSVSLPPRPDAGTWTARIAFSSVASAGSDQKVRLLFEGRIERHVATPVPIPWGAWTLGVTSPTGQFWVSPDSGPHLYSIGTSGQVLTKVSWAPDNFEIDEQEGEFWRETLPDLPPNMTYDRATRVVEGLVSGTDGSVWVMKRRIWGRGVPAQEWLRFTRAGEMIGRLLIPAGQQVLEFGDDYVLLGPLLSVDAQEVRKHGLISPLL